MASFAAELVRLGSAVRLRGACRLVALLAAAFVCAGCGAGEGGAASGRQGGMSDPQAIARAEEILHQAVDGMTPRPVLKVVRPASVGPCLADDTRGEDERVQVRLGYQLTGVPGAQAKNLVKQAGEAWRKRGYGFQSPDAEGDWSSPFPSVFMRTPSDDFWMDATTGIVDRTSGEGLAAITVTSPCFAPSGADAPTPSPAGR